MNRSTSLKIVGAVAAVAEAERQLRDIKGLVDRSLSTAHRFWFVAPMLGAAWAFMVSDDERFAVLEGILDQVFKVVPLEPVERWLAS